MATEFTAVFEVRRGGRFHGYVAELPDIEASGKTLEEARTRLAERLQTVLEKRRKQARAQSGSDAQIEPIRVGRTNQKKGKASPKPPPAKEKKRRRYKEPDLLQFMLEAGLIDEIPPPRSLTDNFEPVPFEGRPISEEIIEDRR